MWECSDVILPQCGNSTVVWEYSEGAPSQCREFLSSVGV